MIRYCLIFTLMLAGPARAEMSLADLVGVWSGSGTYSEALSSAKMKCRLTMTGNTSKVTIVGRCGSSLGANDVVLDLVRQSDGRITLTSAKDAPGIETAITGLSGRITGNQLMLRGEAGAETAATQFVLNADGSVRFAAERKWLTGNSHSIVTLQRR